jgi:hypothetical protein
MLCCDFATRTDGLETEHKAQVTALLVAGRRPGTDPLAAHFGVEDKALIAVAGEPMLSRVARVLADHPNGVDGGGCADQHTFRRKFGECGGGRRA